MTNVIIRKSRLTLILWLIFNLVLSGCSDADTNTSRPKVKPELAPKIVGDKVHFILGKTQFVIPKKYVQGRMGVAHNHLGIPDTAQLWALLPGFEGYSEKNKDEFSYMKTLGWGRRLLIRLELDTRPNHYTVGTLIENVYPYILIKRNYIRKEYDLEVYPKYHFRSNVTSKNSLHHVYFNDTGAPVILFRCSINVPSPACHGRYDFNKEIIVHFDFHLKYLPQWKDIWKNLNALLKNDSSFYSIDND